MTPRNSARSKGYRADRHRISAPINALCATVGVDGIFPKRSCCVQAAFLGVVDGHLARIRYATACIES